MHTVNSRTHSKQTPAYSYAKELARQWSEEENEATLLRESGEIEVWKFGRYASWHASAAEFAKD